ncbi:MAG: FeoB-associated Cys-rich membrane protein [Oscillospiraceae bacterium]|nr:FeoB-associated Cys-rich membrane protein [Oscillospiraceae bacterium]
MNLPTIIAALIVGALVLSIVISGIRNKRQGKSSCSCGSCGGCAMSGACHPKQ